MNKPAAFLIAFAIVIGLVACQPVLQQLPQPTQADPEAGKSTVVGRVVTKDKSPHMETVVRLAEVYRQNGKGSFVLNGAQSPADITDENGFFVFENITPGEYVFVLGDPMDKYSIFSDSDEGGQAKTWTFESGQVFDMGTISIDFP